ncbi:hypothetical protein COOONC_14776 [Cooperia oncophora]
MYMRRKCQHCRLEKCMRIGMRSECTFSIPFLCWLGITSCALVNHKLSIFATRPL